MKLLELEITDVRGIRHLLLSPEGRNVVVWGPNGAGKSAVVDALDFLLTGRMSRLVGPGTAGISLIKHGPHVDSTAEAAKVRGVLSIPGVGRVAMARCIAQPGFLEVHDELRAQLAPTLAVAQKGQHVLTRREILRFVTADAGSRAEQVQHLLNLDDLEALRRTLVTTERESERRTQAARTSVAGSLERASTVMGAAHVDDAVIVNFVNEKRGVLGGDPLAEVKSGHLKDGLTPPSAVVSAATGPSRAIAAATALRDYMTSQTLETEAAARLLIDISTKLATNAQLAIELGRRELTRLGLQLLASDACPLCEHQWPAGDLEARLSARLAAADEAGALQTQRRGATRNLVSIARSTRTRLNSLVEDARLSLGPEELDQLLSWAGRLEETERALESTNGGLLVSVTPGIVETLLPSWAASSIDGLVARWEAEAPASEPSREQLAWDALTRLDEHLGRVETERQDLLKAESVQRRATQLLAAFQSARESVLNGLYESVKGRFVQLYGELHGGDESDFDAVMQPSHTGLDFKVDFHGRGTHPPHALHSEGHQDSMGICLYFALAERLTGGFLDLVILDDVMMSVDADHRRDLCRLLSTAFSEKQLIITTHDRTWAHQLRSERVVTGKDSVQFYGWDVSTGPRVAFAGDVWEEIEADLVAEQVRTAAHRLRRSAEEYFASVCDALRAPVPYKLDGQYELGEFAPAAIERVRKLLKQAKNAAGTWDQREAQERLAEIESTQGQVFLRSNAEQWSINASVHYNLWEDLSSADLHPVLEAFQDLFDVFRCTSCKTLLRVTWAGSSPAALRCSCGAVNWNLQERQRGA